MAEEHGFRASEGHRSCANNCGFSGSPATLNYCHKCYRDLILEHGRTKGADLADSALPVQVSQPAASSPPARHAAVAAEVQLPANRCSACRKKVGLTGFRCRCGVTFCGTHRYPEMHGCAFNYKDAGREAIAKANPLIKALKLEKI
ncbi:hypothetical protein DM860_001085 [Cuscuta australis]|uniref:AN1-type domain-containing protein n=1 Tax=Cuscuta australis TaxID=267555 RepID=A0A328DSU2_9ASTE|nr:hypothetical protein DM860_001085 [Cuscuta australis]